MFGKYIPLSSCVQYFPHLRAIQSLKWGNLYASGSFANGYPSLANELKAAYKKHEIDTL